MKTIDKNIPVIILAGGEGMYPGIQQKFLPKAMVEVKGNPLIYYIIRQYQLSGFSEFYICAGKGKEIISEYTEKKLNDKKTKITVFDTGDDNRTGSRFAQARRFVKGAECVSTTYADTYSDVDISELYKAHIDSGKTATLLAVHLPTRFRILGLVDRDPLVRGFANKPVLERDYINGGFYFFNREIFEMKTLNESPGCVLENEVLEELISKKELNSFRYNGFWQPVDSEKDIKLISRYLSGVNKD